MATAPGRPGELHSSTATIDSNYALLPPGEGLRESAFFVIANKREIAGVNHRVQILLGAWQLRRLAASAADLVSALVVATVPYPGRQVHVRLRAYQTRMRCEVSGMYPAASAVGHAPAADSLPEPDETIELLERLDQQSLAWGRQDFTWGRTFWFELELARP
jgi:hypothetical protein